MDLSARQHNNSNSKPNDDTAPNATGTAEDHDLLLSPLEQEVLDEYVKLAGNLENLSEILADLASKPSAQILDALRGLERSTTTVFTLLKASVYSIVLQQEIFGEEGGDDDGEGTPGGRGAGGMGGR